MRPTHEIRELIERSRPGTPGPWEERRHLDRAADVITRCPDGTGDYLVITEHAGEDARAIAALPELVALAESLLADRERLREALRRYDLHVGDGRGSCPASFHKPEGTCTCGFDAALGDQT